MEDGLREVVYSSNKDYKRGLPQRPVAESLYISLVPPAVYELSAPRTSIALLSFPYGCTTSRLTLAFYRIF